MGYLFHFNWAWNQYKSGKWSGVFGIESWSGNCLIFFETSFNIISLIKKIQPHLGLYLGQGKWSNIFVDVSTRFSSSQWRETNTSHAEFAQGIGTTMLFQSKIKQIKPHWRKSNMLLMWSFRPLPIKLSQLWVQGSIRTLDDNKLSTCCKQSKLVPNF